MKDHTPSDEGRNVWYADACKEIAIGSTAGMVAELFEFPFDLVKVRLQAQVLSFTNRGSGFAYNGPLHCLHRTWTEEGFRGLYRGLSMPLIGAMADTAGLFLAYTSLQNAIRNMNREDSSQKRELTIPEIGVAATGAGFLASFILTPIELVKCRMQIQVMNLHSRGVQSSFKPSSYNTLITESFFSSTPLPFLIAGTSAKPPFRGLIPDTNFISSPPRISFPSNVRTNSSLVKPPGALSIIQNIFRENGLKGFWLGQTGTLFRETGGTAIWFMVKEIVADALRNRKHQNHLAAPSDFPHSAESSTNILLWESAIAGAVAGGVSTLVLYPADTVKSAIQTEEELRPHMRTRQARPPTTFWRTAFNMYHARGLSGFYAGCGMTVVRSVLSSALIFVVYDGLKQAFYW